MAKKQKLHPLSKHFTVSEFEYLQRAIKMISWPVDLQNCAIHMPYSAHLSDTEQMTINHLVNEYGFETIYSDHVKPVTKIFDPKMNHNVGVQRDIEDLIQEVKMPERGQLYLSKMNEKVYIDKIDKGIVTIKFLFSLKPDKRLTLKEWYDGKFEIESR